MKKNIFIPVMIIFLAFSSKMNAQDATTKNNQNYKK
jgi:hypothetical protein